MSDVKIERVSADEERTLPVFAEVEQLMESIRRRAFELSSGHGFDPGCALDDWLEAEREICTSEAEFIESDKDYLLDVALPGFDPSDIEVTATPGELIVHARKRTDDKKESAGAKATVRWSRLGSSDVFRRIELASEIDLERISATLKNGILRIIAPKLQRPVEVVPVSEAA